MEEKWAAVEAAQPLLKDAAHDGSHGVQPRRAWSRRGLFAQASTHALVILVVSVVVLVCFGRRMAHFVATATATTANACLHPYAPFPRPDDPFRFLPCTNQTRPPALDAVDHAAAWAHLYEPDPAHWSWGLLPPPPTPEHERPIFLCGYLDVPLDWTNASDPRIARLAVTRYQVRGPAAGAASARTIVIEPGGPGGSGTAFAWHAAAAVSARLSGGTLDVLGWDPRGVNATQPAASCFAHDAARDRYWQLTHRYREVVGRDNGATRTQLAVADALNDAVFAACRARHDDDLGRFVGTGLVARDLDALRAALGEPALTAYLVSYGTGIGQTYANLFPDRVGRIVLDGPQFLPDEWRLGGFGWTSFADVEHAWREGFLGECVAAAAANACPLVPAGTTASVDLLNQRIRHLVASVAARPVPALTAAAGPSLVTYSALVAAIYASLYQPHTWPAVAQMLADLERGNATLAADMVDTLIYRYDPDKNKLPPRPDSGACAPSGGPALLPALPSSHESMPLVICADAYDSRPDEEGTDDDDDPLAWWDAQWANMTAASWIAGNSRFYNVLPCRRYRAHWPAPPAGVFRGPLNRTLAHPVLVVAETHDPATPLRNGRRLVAAMGKTGADGTAANARLLVHHGYGHASAADPSACTDAVARAYILTGALPAGDGETHCYADGKPYRYEEATAAATGQVGVTPYDGHLAVWQDHVQQLRLWNPGLFRLA